MCWGDKEWVFDQRVLDQNFRHTGEIGFEASSEKDNYNQP